MDTTVTDQLVGRVLDGRYHVDARLARGGMASVYLATDTRLERRVAVKVMHPALADDEAFVARFIREARAAAALSHPNVVAVFDQGADGDTVFLVMEYVAGHTLRDVLRTHGRLSPAQALAVLEPVVAALAAAHRAGLVHRDVKPENVLIANHGHEGAQVKVADFGLARAIAEAHLTSTSTVLIGTASYLAPEQVSRGVADARADVYAAGVMLYELLTGTPPFRGDTPLAIAYQHVHDSVPAPSSVVPDLPAGLDDFVRRAAAQDPDDRPADAGALLTELRRLRGSLGLTAPVPIPSADDDPMATRVINGQTAPLSQPLAVPIPPSHPARATPTGPRRRWPWVAALLALVTAAAAVGGWYLASGRYTDTPKLLGMSVAQAKAAATHDGLKVKVGNAIYSDTYREGLVAQQSPKPTERMRDGGTVTLHPSLGPTHRAVPDVRGKPVAQAVASVKAAHLNPVVVDAVYDPNVAAGLVLRTKPDPGQPVLHDTVVQIVPSKGPPPVAVPDVVGMSAKDAQKAINDVGLKWTVNDAFSDTVPKGKVIAQDPANGTLTLGSTVTLTVSKGPQLFEVPDVTHKNVNEAKSILQQAGFKANVISLPGGPGEVLRQSPGGHSMQRKGTTVTLYVF
jgi:serine/threonine-protein kinase